MCSVCDEFGHWAGDPECSGIPKQATKGQQQHRHAQEVSLYQTHQNFAVSAVNVSQTAPSSDA
eukprot:1283624-Karenia_brevis.AAC.1